MTLEKARALRRGMTRSEVLLWTALRRHQVEGARFKRQVPIGPYIADFACLSLKLVVEVDGESHDFTVGSDARRTSFLEAQGYRDMKWCSFPTTT